MKRGLITWDKSEIPPEIFERRAQTVREVLRARSLSALVVYSDLGRSNQARFFSNFMPYFNRALLVIPAAEQPMTLLCGLTPRTYPWIKSVTPLEDIRAGGPGGNFAKPLFDLAAERGWTNVGVLDVQGLPYDIFRAIHDGPLKIVDVEEVPVDDEVQRAMHAKAFTIARDVLTEEIPSGVGLIDHELVGRLEKRFRVAGAEDVIVLVTNGDTAPRPASGVILEENFSVSVALEYRGHWARISRPQGDAEVLAICEREFRNGAGVLEILREGKRLFYGEGT